MTSQIRLRVPASHRLALTQLASLSDANAELLLAGLSDSAEPLSRATFREVLESIPGLDERDELIDGLFALEAIRATHDWSREEVSEAISSSDDLGLESELREPLQRRLIMLLRVPALARAAKATVLLSSHGRVLHASRVLTDVRPVFDDEVAGSPVGAVVSHQLELNVITAESPSVWYVSLTDEDVRKLQAQLTRALEKADSTRQMLVGANMPIHVGLEVNK